MSAADHEPTAPLPQEPAAPPSDAPPPAAGRLARVRARLAAFWRRRRGEVLKGIVLGVAVHLVFIATRSTGGGRPPNRE